MFYLCQNLDLHMSFTFDLCPHPRILGKMTFLYYVEFGVYLLRILSHFQLMRMNILDRPGSNFWPLRRCMALRFILLHN